MMKYAGADWIENSLRCGPMSELGRNVADLLGELFAGIYHLDSGALSKVEWSNKHHIIIYLSYRTMSTIDNNCLTRLVFLAHHRAIRVELKPCNFQGIKLMFHQRIRGTDGMRCHPTLDEAVETFKKYVSLPEYQNDEKPIYCKNCGDELARTYDGHYRHTNPEPMTPDMSICGKPHPATLESEA